MHCVHTHTHNPTHPFVKNYTHSKLLRTIPLLDFDNDTYSPCL